MTAKSAACQFCRETLEPVQELRYLVEIQFTDAPAVPAPLRRLPSIDGRPLRVCKSCHGSIEADPAGFRAAVGQAQSRARRQRRQQRAGLLTAFGVVSVGWAFALLVGPRAA